MAARTPLSPSSPGHRLVAVGDLFADLVVDLSANDPPARLSDVAGGFDSFGPIAEVAGGSALALAAAGRDAGFGSAAVVGKIGCLADGRPDRAGECLAREAARSGVTLLLACTAEAATGRALLVYDAGGARLMVSDPGANATLTPEDLTDDMRMAARSATAMHASAYTLLQPARARAVELLLKEARKGTAIVALDCAPHNLDRYLRVEDLVEPLSPLVDCVMVELGLAQRYSGASDLEDVLTWWSRWFPHVVVHVSPAHAVVRSGGFDEEVLSDYRPGTSSRGQSACVQAAILGRLATEPEAVAARPVVRAHPLPPSA